MNVCVGEKFGNKLKFIVREPFVGSRLFNPKLLKGEFGKGEKIEFYFADIPNKNPKIKSIDSIEPGTGLPIKILQSEFYQVSP